MPEKLDVFHWKMSAADDRQAIELLRNDITTAANTQQPLSIARILPLVPLQSPQSREIADRGAITFSGSSWSNVAATDLYVEVDDPAIQNMNATIPKVWQGTV